MEPALFDQFLDSIEPDAARTGWNTPRYQQCCRSIASYRTGAPFSVIRFEGLRRGDGFDRA